MLNNISSIENQYDSSTSIFFIIL